jgi:hypothetical protein
MPFTRVIPLIRQERFDDALEACLTDRNSTPDLRFREMCWISAAAAKSNDWSTVRRVGQSMLEMSGLHEEEKNFAASLGIMYSDFELTSKYARARDGDSVAAQIFERKDFITKVRNKLVTDVFPGFESDMKDAEIELRKYGEETASNYGTTSGRSASTSKQGCLTILIAITALTLFVGSRLIA